VLRGPVLERWIARRARQMDQALVGRLVQTIPEPLAVDRPPGIMGGGSVRQILLIADCMWEQNDLVPELAQIAPTQTLDLRPAFKRRSRDEPESGIALRAVREFIAANPRYEPDAILLYARPLLLSDEVFDLLRRTWKCPLLGMNLDDRVQFFQFGILSAGDDNYQRWARKFDLNITNCLPATDWYRQAGCPVIYSPQGVHLTPDLKLPVSVNFKYDFSFLGSKKPERELVIGRLRETGIGIHLFGAGWPKSQWVDKPNDVFRGSQINLGIGLATPSLNVTTVKGRDFECPGVGACYLTTYSWELPLHYELGKEILCYRNFEELVELYAFYRKRPEECLKIAQAAWRRSVAEHTWEKRFRRIFRQLGFKT